MRRFSIMVCVLSAIFVFGLSLAQGQAQKTGFSYEDKIGVVKLKPGEPIHIGVWFVVAGPDASLGIDTKRGVEIAVDDKGGKLLGHSVKLNIQDEGCNAEGGQAAATKLAADSTLVAAIGSNCGSAARAGVPVLWKAGVITISPSNTLPSVTDPGRGPTYDGYLRTAPSKRWRRRLRMERSISAAWLCAMPCMQPRIIRG